MAISAKSQHIISLIPSRYGGIQVNACHYPVCEDYGKDWSTGKSSGVSPPYIYESHGICRLTCAACGRSVFIKDNRALHGIVQRLRDTGRYVSPACPNPGCANHDRPVLEHPTAYWRLADEEAQDRTTIRCKECGAEHCIDVGSKTPFRSAVDHYVYRALMHRVAMRNIQAIFNLGQWAIYRRIRFLYEQALLFAQFHEQPQLALLGSQVDAKGCRSPRELMISTDAQDFSLNYRSRRDGHPLKLHAITSALMGSGYIVAATLNFDPEVDLRDIAKEKETLEGKLRFERHHPHLYVPKYKSFDATKVAGMGKAEKTKNRFQGGINDRYAMESSEPGLRNTANQNRSSKTGARILLDYAAAAHFIRVNELLPSLDRQHHFLDGDKWLASAATIALQERINADRAYVFKVKYEKKLKLDKNQQHHDEALAKLKEDAKLTEAQAEDAKQLIAAARALTHDRLRALGARAAAARQKHKYLQAKSLTVPVAFPVKREARKEMTLLSHDAQRRRGTMARLINSGRMTQLDTYFQTLRRKLSTLERPLVTSTEKSRYLGFTAVNPIYADQLLAVFRVYYNFCHVRGKDKSTPARRLGITDRIFTIADIIGFDPEISEVRRLVAPLYGPQMSEEAKAEHLIRIETERRRAIRRAKADRRNAKRRANRAAQRHDQKPPP